jgi:hypothetical protein
VSGLLELVTWVAFVAGAAVVVAFLFSHPR